MLSGEQTVPNSTYNTKVSICSKHYYIVAYKPIVIQNALKYKQAKASLREPRTIATRRPRIYNFLLPVQQVTNKSIAKNRNFVAYYLDNEYPRVIST